MDASQVLILEGLTTTCTDAEMQTAYAAGDAEEGFVGPVQAPADGVQVW